MWLIDGLPIHPLVVHAPVVLVAMLAVGLALFTVSPRTTTPTSPAGPVSVAIKAFAFEPATVNVAVGQSGVWTNQDPAPPTATGNGFNTGSLALGALIWQ